MFIDFSKFPLQISVWFVQFSVSHPHLKDRVKPCLLNLSQSISKSESQFFGIFSPALSQSHLQGLHVRRFDEHEVCIDVGFENLLCSLDVDFKNTDFELRLEPIDLRPQSPICISVHLSVLQKFLLRHQLFELLCLHKVVFSPIYFSWPQTPSRRWYCFCEVLWELFHQHA